MLTPCACHEWARTGPCPSLVSVRRVRANSSRYGGSAARGKVRAREAQARGLRGDRLTCPENVKATVLQMSQHLIMVAKILPRRRRYKAPFRAVRRARNVSTRHIG